ncbi:hypothetical protein L2E82_47563 [Cichorium intybus]|uniref:Uncharacterized protein n=1 Tax=Cichorium intybus TaxID=13427 RepID=A0ACB8YVW9_CICIN|nr:hypothetical protein L2E82_47563 [Cichorium intybus]
MVQTPPSEPCENTHHFHMEQETQIRTPLLLKADQIQVLYEENEEQQQQEEESSSHLDGDLQQLDFYLLLLGFNQYSVLRFGISWVTFLTTTNCFRCDLYQVKGFELVVISSQACLAAAALLCLSHNLRKYGIRNFLFVDQYNGHGILYTS